MSKVDPKVIDAAIRLLAGDGHKSATTRRIAHEAGVSQSTIFRLHGDKYRLLHDVFTALVPEGTTSDPSVLLGKEDIAAGLACLLEEYAATIARYYPAMKLSMQLSDDENFSTDPDIVLGPYVEQLAQYLQNLCAQKRIVQADFRAISQLVFSMLLMQAPDLAKNGAESGRDEEAHSRLSWKHALFLERKLKVKSNGDGAVEFSRKRENRSSDIRENNLRAVLRLFMDADKLSAPELQKEVHLSKTTILKLITQLFDDGLLLDLGTDSSVDERGRPPSYYCLNRDFGYGLVVQFLPESILTVATNLKNEIMHIHSVPITPQLTFDDAIAIIVDSFRKVLAHLGIEHGRIVGLCVATGGPTNEDDGSIAYWPRFHNWSKHSPMKKTLQERLPGGFPIILNNEMYCQSVGEQFFGKAYGRRSALIFEAGEKLGSGVILDNRLLLGAHAIAGEIGHIKLDPHSDVQCVCGAYGCFRALVHSDRVVAMARAGLGKFPDSLLHDVDGLAVSDVFTALKAGDALAVQVMDEIGRWMGMALSNLILTIDPEIIVLQGIYSQAGPAFLRMIRRYLVQDKFPYLGELNLAVEYSALGGNACLLGGSKLITESLLNRYCKQTGI